MFPLRIVPPERFAALRGFLARSRYQEARVCDRLGIQTIYRFNSLRQAEPEGVPSDSLDVLIRLFMDGKKLDHGIVRTLLSADDIALLEGFGMLTADAAEGGTYGSTTLLYPTGSLYIASDRTPSPEDPSPPADLVYSAISESTRRFLAALPAAPCDNFLELCAGTGIAALRAAPLARQAWAADIGARATHFARFNGLLNGADNFTAVQGDLFEAVPDQTFDRICAHPPYMPALEQECLYQDGGSDGEQISRRIVAALPRYLREGGRFYCYCMASDRRDSPAEVRVRELLGDAAGEFDVAVVSLEGYRAEEYYSLLLASRAVAASAVEAHLAALQRLRVRQLVFCWIVIQRRHIPRPVFTVRRKSGETTAQDEIDWLLRRETAVVEGDSAEWLLEARPLPSPGARLHVAYGPGESGWAPTERSLQTDAPFRLAAKCPAWAAEFVVACDGKTTVRQHLAALEASGVIPERTSEEAFLASVSVLLAGGFIYVEGLKPPNATA